MIQFGSDKIKEIYVGSDKIKEVYHGNELVWSGKKPSYAILTDGTRVDFELENTPMSNFEGYASTVTINGTSYQKNTIKEITFGNSYGQVTSMGNGAFYHFPSLTSITLPESLTSIGDESFSLCAYLTSITFPEGLTSIGYMTFYYCASLSLVTSLPTIPPSLGNAAFYYTHANLIIKVPAQSVQAYKTATNWTEYASKISAI